MGRKITGREHSVRVQYLWLGIFFLQCHTCNWKKFARKMRHEADEEYVNHWLIEC